MVAQRSANLLFFVEEVLVPWQTPSIKKIMSQLQKELEPVYLKLHFKILEKLSVDEKISKHLQKIMEQNQIENSWQMEGKNPSVELVEPFLENQWLLQRNF